MNAEQLRAVQAPLKTKYREMPDAARIPARAEASLDPVEIACTVPSWHNSVTAGLHESAGGSGKLACSADMLLQALAACAGVTLRAVATAYGVEIRRGRVIADGVWDVRGTLGIDRTVPVGITEISLTFEIDADADDDKLQKMIETTERYCVIFQTLRTPPTLSVKRAA